MWFDVDIRKLSAQLLPTELRSLDVQAFVKALVKPIADVHYQFTQKRKEDLYIMAHNGQKCYLRAVLRDKFDPDLRRIEIDDGDLYDAEYIFTDAEIEENKFLANWLDLYIYQDENLSDSAVDFYVKVPADIFYNEYEMKYYIDYYKLASKRYKIVTI